MAWKKALVGASSGIAAGAVDQLVQNWDEKRVSAEPTLPIWQQGGTWLNYILPAALVLAVGTGYLKNDWFNEQGVTIAGQLAGRKVTHRFTKGPNSPFPSPAPYSVWSRARAAAPAPQTTQPEFAGDNNRIY